MHLEMSLQVVHVLETLATNVTAKILHQHLVHRPYMAFQRLRGGKNVTTLVTVELHPAVDDVNVLLKLALHLVALLALAALEAIWPGTGVAVTLPAVLEHLAATLPIELKLSWTIKEEKMRE